VSILYSVLQVPCLTFLSLTFLYFFRLVSCRSLPGTELCWALARLVLQKSVPLLVCVPARHETSPHFLPLLFRHETGLLFLRVLARYELTPQLLLSVQHEMTPLPRESLPSAARRHLPPVGGSLYNMCDFVRHKHLLILSAKKNAVYYYTI
jgi:hypothetical protein